MRGKILWFTIEMTVREISSRLLSIISRVPLTKILERKLSNEDLLKISAAIKRISESGLYVSGDPVRVSDITRIVDNVSKTGKIDMVVVDYAQLVSPERKKDQNREQEVGGVGWELKLLAKKYNCVVILLSQLNKDGISRESEALEMHADIILIVEEHGNKSKKWIRVTKQRNGPTGSVEANWCASYVVIY
jgi:replicative DNA helicase